LPLCFPAIIDDRELGNSCHLIQGEQPPLPMPEVNAWRSRREGQTHGRWSRHGGLERRPFRIHKSKQVRDFEMKSVVVMCMAVVFLWVVDIELNDGRYSDVTGRAIVGLVGK
jgi:hypothetical protein